MRHLIGILCLILLLFSCRDRVICPAFQSTYILDDSVRIAYFSYIWELDDEDRISILEQRTSQNDSINELGGGIIALSDTTQADSLQQDAGMDYYAYVEDFIVPPRDVRKNKYGIIKYEPYWLKNYFLRSAPMENILSPEPEDLGIEPLAEEGLLALGSESDSTLSPVVALDSGSLVATTDSLATPESEVLALAEPEEEKGPRFLFKYDPEDNFNVEQVYYNKWFGRQLIYQPPKPKPEIQPLATDSVVTDVEPIDPSSIVDEPVEQIESDTETIPDTEEAPPVEETPPPPPPANEPVIEGENDDLGF